VTESEYRRIRADIIFGRLRPDQKLRLEAMKDDYGVSVSTLREILSRLSSEGFVIAESDQKTATRQAQFEMRLSG
jgi:GntR family carbon starvation induced transcriptional regulator